MAGLIWAWFQPNPLADVSASLQVLLADNPFLLEQLDPGNIVVANRIQEVVVFLIVAGILALSSRRTRALVIRQSQIARERANLTRHFPPSMVDRLADQDQPLGAVREQTVTVMFVDIVGFTKMAEDHTPEQTVALLREFHARVEHLVFEHHGTLDKFLGDGLMTTFGTPDPGPHDASNALACARAMLAEIDAWNVERTAKGDELIRLAIGIHRGPAVLGDLGTELRLEYAVLGDTVNVASRLEALTRKLGVRLAVSQELTDAARAESASDPSDLILAGPQKLRGREEPVTVWTL